MAAAGTGGSNSFVQDAETAQRDGTCPSPHLHPGHLSSGPTTGHPGRGDSARIRTLQEAAAPSSEHGLCSSKLLQGFLSSELPSPAGRAGSSSYWCAAELAAPSSNLGVCWDSSDSSPTSHGNGIQRAQSSMLQYGWKTCLYQARKYLKD